MVACPAGTLFLPVSPKPDNVCCHGSANLCKFLFVLTAWGDCFLSFPLVPYQSDLTCTVGQFFIGFLFGLACGPTDSSIARFCGLFSRGTPILAGGIGVARVVKGLFFLVLVCGFEQL